MGYLPCLYGLVCLVCEWGYLPCLYGIVWYCLVCEWGYLPCLSGIVWYCLVCEWGYLPCLYGLDGMEWCVNGGICLVWKGNIGYLLYQRN